MRTIEPVAHELGIQRLTLEEAFAEYYQRVLRLSFLLIGQRDVAEDLAQETFVRVAGRIQGLENSRVLGYLRQTTVNLAKNRIRRASLERRLRPRALRAEGADPSMAVEEHIILWDAVRRLPRQQRVALVLRYYEQLTEGETAQVMGCAIGTVKSNVSRALSKLREEMTNEDRG